LKQAEQDMAKLDWSNSTLREAEQYFRKGQREYLSRNFGRSIESFQTALSLFRGHELADKYLRLAVYNAEQEAKRHMEAGIRYFESLQYQRAIYHFNEVISLMAHRPSEAIVSESEKYIVLSKKRLQAAELFP
jgi:tetratricopeptide (TPR) repeat protein